MLERLNLGFNNQYFIVTKKITKGDLTSCFLVFSENKIKKPKKGLRTPVQIGNTKFLISYCLFKQERKPAFLLYGEEKDIAHSIAIIIEFDKYLVINKIGGLDFTNIISSKIKYINPTTLQNLFIADDSEIQKIVAKNINHRKNTLKQITYIDDDLTHSLPVNGASQKLIQNLKHKTNGITYSTTGKKSRLNILGQKREISDFCSRVQNVFTRVENYKQKNNFLNIFARTLEFNEWCDILNPTEILFLSTELLNDFENYDGNIIFYYKYKNEKRPLEISIENLIKDYMKLYDLNPNNLTSFSYPLKINNTFDKAFYIDKINERFVLSSSKLKNLYISFGDDQIIPLLKYINLKQDFLISYSKSNIKYSNGQFCQDTNLLSTIPYFLKAFFVDPSLSSIISEKGNTKSYNHTTSKFDTNSLFDYVERKFMPGLDLLICDDFGLETSDYIGILKGKKIQLFHCKYANSVFSASDFQVIVGQALKNLNFFFQNSEVDKKIDLWSSKYASTNIDRVRKGKPSEIKEILQDAILSNNYDRELYLIVNYLEYDTVHLELNKLKNNEVAKRQTNSLLWLLSALKNSCDERGVKLIITCK